VQILRFGATSIEVAAFDPPDRDNAAGVARSRALAGVATLGVVGSGAQGASVSVVMEGFCACEVLTG